MSEYRQDRTTGAWVIIAPERGRRPGQWRRSGVATESIPVFDPACPFCPGNERLLPGIIDETASAATPGWRVRVVPNKYPALRADLAPEEPGKDTQPIAAGFGHHEVIIETGRHNADLATLAEPELTAVVQAYQRRYVALMARPSVRSVLVFRNHGRRAGASLPHPHSQVIAIGMAPPRLAAVSAWARSHYAQQGRCPACQTLALELENGRRIVEATERFLLFVPFAAAAPFEQRILPRRHQASFAEADAADLLEFARLLQRALYRLKATLGNPPYNFVVESGTTDDADSPYMHWGLRIVPDLVTPGGFELGAGLPINPSRPEDDAEALRASAAAPNQEAR